MDKKCHICGGKADHIHHVFQGIGRRKVSDRHKAVVPLCEVCHMEVHKYAFNRLALQEEIQRKMMEENNWTIEDFRKIFGKNYL